MFFLFFSLTMFQDNLMYSLGLLDIAQLPVCMNMGMSSLSCCELFHHPTCVVSSEYYNYSTPWVTGTRTVVHGDKSSAHIITLNLPCTVDIQKDCLE